MKYMFKENVILKNSDFSKYLATQPSENCLDYLQQVVEIEAILLYIMSSRNVDYDAAASGLNS